jgi:hypothetical protein
LSRVRSSHNEMHQVPAAAIDPGVRCSYAVVVDDTADRHCNCMEVCPCWDRVLASSEPALSVSWIVAAYKSIRTQ